MRAVSVGFRPTVQPKRVVDAEDNLAGGYEFNGQELLELSAVPIPANPEALQRAVAAGIEQRDLGRVFVRNEAPIALTAEMDIDFAREIIAARAARAGAPPVECCDMEAILRARLICTLSHVDRGLAQLQELLSLPSHAGTAEEKFLLELTGSAISVTPLDSFWESLGS